MHDRPRKKRPRDLSQLARQIVEEATGEPLTPRAEPPAEAEREDTRNPHAVALGELGGRKGGIARRDKLTPERRREIAASAARARWERMREDGEK